METKSLLTIVVVSVFIGVAWGTGESKSSCAVVAVCRADVRRHSQLREAEGVAGLQHSQSRRAGRLMGRSGQEDTDAQGAIEIRHAKSVREGDIDISPSDLECQTTSRVHICVHWRLDVPLKQPYRDAV